MTSETALPEALHTPIRGVDQEVNGRGDETAPTSSARCVQWKK
jgi:hypothetical protein